MIALVCPGQGSQTPGFLAPWLELPGLRERAEALSDAAGVDLVTHGTTSDADTIRDTAVAQPLIVGAGLLALDALYADRPDTLASSAGVVAGHSVGEITGATPTGMSAVVGGDPAEVAAALDRHGLTPANMNGAGQVVAAGTLEQLAAFAADPPAKTRVIPLQVAGAFHTVHMAPAADELSAEWSDHNVSDPGVTLLSNTDGVAVATGAEFLRRLISQVRNPVRWDLCMETMTELGVTGLVELAPAGTLVGLAKRAMKGVPTVALKTPDDLDAAAGLLAASTSAKGLT